MSTNRKVNVSRLTPGSLLDDSIFDERRTKLLRSGYPVDERIIRRLAELGIKDVAVKAEAVRATKDARSSAHPIASVKVIDRSNASLPVTRLCTCGIAITIQPPIADAPASMWHCNTCGLVYFGFGGRAHDIHSASVERAAKGDGIIQTAINPTESNSMPPSEDRPRRIAAGDYSGRERRRQRRDPVAVPVVAIPLATDFQIAGDAVRMMTRNISRIGIALAHTRFTNAPYFALDFTSAGMELMQVLLKVLRVTAIAPVYEVAGTFISQLVHSPTLD